MARKKSIDTEQTKIILLDTGLALLEEHGFNATGIQEITAKAGIPKGSFYNYFASKEEFAAAIIAHYSQTRLVQWQALWQEQPAEDADGILRVLFGYLDAKYAAASPKKGCLLGNLAGEISEASEECRQALQTAIQAYKAVVIKGVERGQQTGRLRCDASPEALADLIWDVWQGALLRMKVENSIEPVRRDLALLLKTLLVK